MLNIDLENYKSPESLSVIITDITGKTIKYFKSVTTKHFSIDLSKYSKGLYLIKINNYYHSEVRKFVIE